MGMNTEDRNSIRKSAKQKRKIIWELEEVIDLLAKLDDAGHSRKQVFLELTDGQRIPVSFIELDKAEGVVVIG